MARNRIAIKLLLDIAKEVSQRLAANRISHMVLGGVAVHLHGVERKDGDDVDVLIAAENEQKVSAVLSKEGFKKNGRYFEKGDGVRIEISDRRKFSSCPNLDDEQEWIEIEGVRVPTIDNMIKMKAEASKDICTTIMEKNGKVGTTTRNAFIKHSNDLSGLFRVYARRKS
jgi:aminoglycoside-2''-adenylyltransferase